MSFLIIVMWYTYMKKDTQVSFTYTWYSWELYKTGGDKNAVRKWELLYDKETEKIDEGASQGDTWRVPNRIQSRKLCKAGWAWWHMPLVPGRGKFIFCVQGQSSWQQILGQPGT